MAKEKREPFSFTRHGPEVEFLYKQEGLSVSAIAKRLHRGYQTILNYLKEKGLYRGPESIIEAKQKAKVQRSEGRIPSEHIPDKLYFSLKHNSTAIFQAYYGEGEQKACRIFLNDPDFLYHAYCKPEELIV